MQPGDNTTDLQVTGLNLGNGASIQDEAGNNLAGSVAQDLSLQIDTAPPSVLPFVTYSTLDDPSAAYGTYANGINDNGEVVGYFYDSNDVAHGFVESDGNYTQLDDPSAAYGTYANGINDNGEVVGYFYDSNYVAHGFLQSGGNYTELDDPSAAYGTYANGINNNGQVVGYYYDSNYVAHGFLQSGGNYTELDDPSAAYGTYANGINNNGQVVGYFYDSNDVAHGFVESGGNYTELDDPSAVYGTYALGINDNGEVVGYFYDSNDVAHGFVESGGNYTELDDPSAANGTNAAGINDGGEIVGFYLNNSYQESAFVTSPASPAPVVASPATGDEGVGQEITITVSMTEPVVVAGIPELALNDGGDAYYDPTATAALNDPTELVFDYTVGPGDTNVSALGVTGFSPDGATVQDLAGNNANFSGVEVTFQGLQITPCYCRGTLIRTDRGEIPVENLAIGDEVMTAIGRRATDQMDRAAQLWRSLRHGPQGHSADLHQGRRAR